MNFPSIDIQGSILSAETLGKIRSEQELFQQGKDFSPELNNSKLKDEISFAWQEAKGQWVILKSKLARLKENQSGTTETRNFWVIPLLSNLGYNLAFTAKSEELNGKLFQIQYRDPSMDNFPVYIGGFYESLDKRPPNKQLRVSPHAMLQEYLNYSEHLYGIITNGRQLRLLRDASRITRLSYFEFNLEKMMEEDLYSDFVILYRLLHSSRMPRKANEGPDSIIEQYHQHGLEAGSTIRNKLGEAVKESILMLANGFINHPDNANLRSSLANSNLHSDEYFHVLLRIVYRLLFLFVIEERNLVYGESKTPETRRFSQIYFSYYSLIRLRKLAKKLPPPDAERHYDLWEGLLSTFALFEDQAIGSKLGIMSLEGDLFGYNALCGNGFDLHKCRLNNAILLRILKSLTFFENENTVLISVNYGGLDVEEFGSVYEGLLELKLVVRKRDGHESYVCEFDAGNERSKSGSHYTPEELVQPLIKHSLEYLIEDRIKNPQHFLTVLEAENKTISEQKVKAILKLKVCDISCGSGHILLSAARRIALEVARIQTDEEQPNPSAIRKALREVVRHCIYGVDRNELAVELCKVALWLEAYNPGEPLSFLDHHIKCGDSIIGLVKKEDLYRGIPLEAFKKMPGDDSSVIKELLKKHRNEIAGNQSMFESLDIGKSLQEISMQFIEIDTLPELTLADVKEKSLRYNALKESNWRCLKEAADLLITQFFVPKLRENMQSIATYSDYVDVNTRKRTDIEEKVEKAIKIASQMKFFHWFLEFPEVTELGGFNCILGNPPYLGGSKISTHYGNYYLNCIKTLFAPTYGLGDLVAYFGKRIFNLLNVDGIFAIISTNSIYQGDSRLACLDYIYENSGEINFAIRSIKWPGVANLMVSLLAISKYKHFKREKFLEGKKVNFISQFLDEESPSIPFSLAANKGICYFGSSVLGEGFYLDHKTAQKYWESNPNYLKVIKYCYNGEDLNNSYDLSPSRAIVYFYDWDYEKLGDYQELLDNIKHNIIKERTSGNQKSYAKTWWKYKRPTVVIYKQIEKLKFCFVAARTTRYLNLSKAPNNYIFTDGTVVFAFDKFSSYAILQSVIHLEWATKYSSSLANTLRYAPSDCFESFPFPPILSKEIENKLETIGEQYYELRLRLMQNLQLGLTKTYNIFHTQHLSDTSVQLTKARLQVPIEQVIMETEVLREFQKKMDNEVLNAYGWKDIILAHDFYEVDYLPNNDKVRYTICPKARKEILLRLLELNYKIHNEEVRTGIFGKQKKTISSKKTTIRGEGQESLNF